MWMAWIQKPSGKYSENAKKQQTTENQKIPKQKPSGRPVFTFSFPWGAIRPSAPS